VRTKTTAQAEKIMTAAAKLFATHRFHEARMEDIAALAEVGKGTLYRYFKDKEELYLALLERAGEGLSLRLDEALAGVEGARAQLVALVAGLLAYFEDNPHLFDLIQHAEAMQRPGVEFPWQKRRNENLVLTKRILAEGVRSGEWVVADPDLATLMLLGGLRAVWRFGVKPRPADLAERVVACFVAGLECGPPLCGGSCEEPPRSGGLHSPPLPAHPSPFVVSG
jgi:AcrR family transcriptional regulator